MEGDRWSGDVAPLFFQLDSKTDVSCQTVQPGHFTARDLAGVRTLSAESNVDILEKR